MKQTRLVPFIVASALFLETLDLQFWPRLIADRFGACNVFCSAIAVFALGSVLCGYLVMLGFFRSLQFTA